jgi:hypothetical protein
MGAVQLQATFSVAAGRSFHQGFGTNDGAHLSKGCTRGTIGWWCVLPLLRVLRFTTVAVALAICHSRRSQTCTPRCDPYTTVLV